MIPVEKQSWRARALDLLRALSPDERATRSAAIAGHLCGIPEPLLGFAPLRLEPDWLAGWAGGEVGLPRIESGRLCFHRAKSADLVPGPFGAREPRPDAAPRCDVNAAATILVPGLAFDPTGGRLGRGGGFYDRFLAGPSVRARRVGVCFACQLVALVPRESHDAGVDAIVTEDGWIECRNTARDPGEAGSPPARW